MNKQKALPKPVSIETKLKYGLSSPCLVSQSEALQSYPLTLPGEAVWAARLGNLWITSFNSQQ